MVFVADLAERLDKFLARKLPDHSRTRLVRLIEAGGVVVDGVPQKPSFKLGPGCIVSVLREPPPEPAHNLEPAAIPLEVVYEDASLLVVDKPRGLATHPARSLRVPSLVNALLARSGTLSSGSEEFRPGIVHRLDKDTTGLLIVAKTDAAHWKLAKQIASRSVDRRYVALLSGVLEQDSFKIDAPLARDQRNRLKMAVDVTGKAAVTHVRALRRLESDTLVACRLETGRTHQIRVHLASVGHPVVGDRLYNPRPSELPLQLHAAFLAFEHPVTGARIELFCDPPEDFLARTHVNRADVLRA